MSRCFFASQFGFVMRGIVRRFNDFTDVGDAQVGENDSLQDTVRNIKPEADQAGQDERYHNVDKFHQDERPENIAKESQGQ